MTTGTDEPRAVSGPAPLMPRCLIALNAAARAGRLARRRSRHRRTAEAGKREGRVSLAVTEHVWWACDRRGGARLLLLALAERAGDDGAGDPSVATLAGMTRLSVRHCRRLLRSLEDGGEVTVLRAGGGGLTSLYQVNLLPVRHESGAASDAEKVNLRPCAPNPAPCPTPTWRGGRHERG